MATLEYILMVALLVSACVIVIAVLLQKSSDEGLSGTIAGGSDTYYGKDKSAHTERKLFKWTVVFSVIFALCVLAVYVIQPDHADKYALDGWESLSNYAFLFK
jgi:preprotein translocase subunit SecG